MSSLDLINYGLYTEERKYFGTDYPIALNTIFGWIIAGSYTACDDHSTPAVTHHADLDTMVRSIMEMDNLQPNQSLLDFSDPTDSHFAKTHTRSEDGVYIVEYPLKDGAPPIESTLPQATNRLVLLERRFRRHPELKKQYEEFLDDYLQLGHMEQLTSAQLKDDPCVYLPHHAVIKQDRLTTKSRVVFDGSWKDSSGISLNDRLHIGPPIQRDLLGVCLRCLRTDMFYVQILKRCLEGFKFPGVTPIFNVLCGAKMRMNLA